MGKRVRVRFAPSPTGPLHIGGVRTALYNYLFAKKNNGDFILRIEDTDKNRFVSGTEEYIIEALNWLNIKFNEGVGIGGNHVPYKQSEREDIYKQYAQQLVKSGFAYYAFDTPEELDIKRKECESRKETFQYGISTRNAMKNSFTIEEEEIQKKINNNEHYVIRIKIPAGEIIHINDIIRGNVEVQSSQLDDKVLFKSDGMPTYHLANVVDDYLMKISHVIRGEEWLPSTPLHVLLYKYFGWENEMPLFAHLPLLLKPDGKGKLSKRDGDKLGFPVFPLQWVDPVTKEISSGYRESGYVPEAVNNIIALLGWNPGSEKEIFSMDELIEEFSLEKVGKAGCRFDYEKAKWFNHQYISKINNEELAEYLNEILKSKKINSSKENLIKICELIKDRMNFMNEIWDKSEYFFRQPTTYDEKVLKDKWNENIPSTLNNIVGKLKSISGFTSAEIENIIKEYIQVNNLNAGTVMTVLRVLIVGKNSGPELFKIFEIIGKEETIKRVEKGTKEFKV
ncbi:MAG: glutamate--tRNA ligase [Bacteroidales bacterium]|nr:glutamate--tRNA ligase [Bacteroidales bacterium]